MFPEELPGLPSRWEMEFSIKILLGTMHISLAPYRMTPVKLAKFKVQL